MFLIKKQFIKDYINIFNNTKLVLRKGRRVLLGNNYNKLSKYFNIDTFQNFISNILINESINLSQSINDIYDYNDEQDLSHGEINFKIENGLKKYSTEELISSLGNHTINYSTTFKLILKEVYFRVGEGNLYNLIKNNVNLDEKGKDFLIGQILIGLSARGEITKLNIFINNIHNKKEVENIIKKIIDYKNNKLFNLTSYTGLLVGLVRLLEKNNFVKDIIGNIFSTGDYNNFNFGLITSLLLKGKIELVKDFIGNDYKQTEYYKDYKNSIKYSSINKEIFTKSVNDIVMIYGGEGSGGGAERYNVEINKFLKTFHYKIIKSNEGFTLLEKDGIRISFINYDIIGGKNVENLLINEGVNQNLIVYRGHNYYTSEMILKSINLDNKSTINDGGCRNISMIDKYRENNIKNQVIAYDSTGIGSETLSLVTGYIQMIRDVKSGKNNINDFDTWIKLKERLKSKYIKEHMVFPGSLIDIIGRKEKEY